MNNVSFQSVVDDSRNWAKFGDIDERLAKEPLGKDNPKFLNGTATSEYQLLGSFHCPDSQWAEWEKKCISDESNRSGNDTQGLSTNFYELYQTADGRNEIIRRLQNLGVNSYRFSIEWSLLEPVKGQFNEKVLDRYITFCEQLRDNGIQPMVTLLHFSEPNWWYLEGNFEKEECTEAFVNFSERVFKPLTNLYKGAPLVEYFCTINEPAIEAFSRFVRGAFAPGVKMDFNRARNYLNNALKAHCIVYQRLKVINPDVQIGIVHQYLRFIPSNFALKIATNPLNSLINDFVFNFFKERGNNEVDFVGVQYYARPVIGLTGSTSFHEPMTAMPFREDPALYEAIVETFKVFKKPIIVTENGISPVDEEQRERYMKRAMFSACEAQKVIGPENLKGYYVWSLVDNFEWDMGMEPNKFGVYALERQKDGSMKMAETYKKGIEPFVRNNKAFNELHAKK